MTTTIRFRRSNRCGTNCVEAGSLSELRTDPDD